MSKILINVDYIKLSQLTAFGKFSAKRQNHNHVLKAFDMIEDVLDSAVDPNVLKQIKPAKFQ